MAGGGAPEPQFAAFVWDVGGAGESASGGEAGNIQGSLATPVWGSLCGTENVKGTPPARPGASVSPRSQKRPLVTSPLRLSEPDTPRSGCCARRRPHAAAGRTWRRGAPVRTCAHLPPTRRVPAAGWGAREKLGAPRPQGADGFRSSRAAVLAGGSPAAPRRRRPGLGGKPPAPSRRPSPRVCSAREEAPEPGARAGKAQR